MGERARALLLELFRFRQGVDLATVESSVGFDGFVLGWFRLASLSLAFAYGSGQEKKRRKKLSLSMLLSLRLLSMLLPLQLGHVLYLPEQRGLLWWG